MKTMSIDTAKRLLNATDYCDYKVVATYENGFKATRTNEWCKTELYCEVFVDDPETLWGEDVLKWTQIVTMVVERYK